MNNSVHILYSIPESWANYHSVMRKSILKLISGSPFKEKIKILDIGCGRGELLADLKRINAIPFGLDMDEECVRMSSQHGTVVLGDISSIYNHYEKESFDLVIASHVIEHLDNPREGIEALKYASSKYIILAVPNLSQFVNLRWRQKTPGFVNKGHKVGWDAAHLHTFLVYACGLDVLRWQPDRVFLHSRFATIAKLLRIERYLKDNLLPRLFPLQSRSLIVLCAKR